MDKFAGRTCLCMRETVLDDFGRIICSRMRTLLLETSEKAIGIMRQLDFLVCYTRM